MSTTPPQEKTKARSLGADFRTRALTALVGAPIILLAVIIGRPVFDVLVVGVGLAAGLELLHMLRPPTDITRALSLLLIVACIGGVSLLLPIQIIATAAVFLVVGLALWTMSASVPFTRGVLYPLLGALYIGLPLGVVLLLRHGENGLLWTIMLFANNWATDAFALIGGRVAGRHKLAPKISPGKTIEGAAIGLTLGFLVGLTIALIGGIPPGTAILANIVVAFATEIGDLFESWTKRRLAVKDSGSLLPGHGGVLDRVDGTLLAAPLLYLVVALVG